MTISFRHALAANLLLLAGLAAAPAKAECQGSAETDSCVFGAWRQSGGGAMEWMKRNMPPGMPVPQIDQSGQIMAFNEDGTYWTAPSTSKTTVKIEGSGGTVRAEGDLTMQANGRWSAEGGKLNLCPDKQSVKGQMRMTGPGGAQHAMPMGPMADAQPMSLDYTCAGGEMETRIAIPGMNDPMVTRFARAK